MDKMTVYILESIKKTNKKIGLLALGLGLFIHYTDKRMTKMNKRISELEDKIILLKEGESET